MSALRVEWRLKACLTFLLSAGFCLLYFGLQRYQWREPTLVPTIPLDDLIPFRAGWTWVYQSLYLLTPIAPWLARSRAELARYVKGFLAVSLAGFAVFALLPTAVARPAPAGGLHSWLLSYDGASNAFPSLHAALAVYSALCGPRKAILLLWAGAIVYSTLATKQHVAADAAAGVLLGACGWAWARWTGGEAKHDERLQVVEGREGRADGAGHRAGGRRRDARRDERGARGGPGGAHQAQERL